MTALFNRNGGGKPLISISLPVLNEAQNIHALYKRLDALAIRMRDKCELEFVFSDNHSDDETWTLLSELAARDPRVRTISFSKNYGFQRSILANYLHTGGGAGGRAGAGGRGPPGGGGAGGGRGRQ